MKLTSLYIVLIVGFALAHSSVAATFTVDIAADDADAHDANIGNGVCADATGFCTLRAAIEEANFTAAADFILFADFSVPQTLTLAASEGPLPAIIHPLAIVASSIANYNSNATSPLDAPPQFIIDGSQLGGLPSGLLFQGNSSGSAVTALGVVNFKGNGILMRQGADGVSIDRCYVGILANGNAAGNGYNGIHAFETDGHKIGRFENGSGFDGLGNMVSSNGRSGIRLEDSTDNVVLGNVLGVAPNGSGGRGNGSGILATGNRNIIGNEHGDAGIGNGNMVGASHSFGISIDGNNNEIVGNFIGVDESFADIGNQGDGLYVEGRGAIVRRNVIGFNGGSGVVSNDLGNSRLSSNNVGIALNGNDIGNDEFGLLVTNTSEILDIQVNEIALNGRAGIGLDNTVTSVFMGANSMHNNNGLGIDLGNDGTTINDPGDADEGANRLQNFPLIESAILATQGPFTTLSVHYRVSSATNNADYPLFIDFYWTHIDEAAQGRFYLGRGIYQTPDALANHLLELPTGTPGGWLTATATDGFEGPLGVPVNLNTSEFAARFEFGDTSGLLFSDGFED